MKALEDAQTLLKELAYPVDVDDPKAGCVLGVCEEGSPKLPKWCLALNFSAKFLFYSHHCSLDFME